MSAPVATNGSDIEKGGRTHHDHVASTAAPVSPFRPIANPAPLGLCGFALTTFVLSLVNVQAKGMTVTNVVVGLALFYGGLAQFAAGMWEFACGNAFGATAFSSYGGFWLSWAVVQIPGFNVVGAYGTKAAELHNALGFYLMGWFIFTFIMFICTFRATAALIFLFFVLDLAFLFLAISEFTGNSKCALAGGYFGLLAAFAAWYCAAAALLTPKTSYFSLPVVSLAPKED